MKTRRVPYRPGSDGSFQTDTSICKSLRDGSLTSWDLAGREGVLAQNENGIRISWMVPVLCPDMTAVLDDARSGRAVQTRSLGGKFLVSPTPLPGAATIQPGTWTSEQASVSDCYWERSDADGDTIENNFISIAPAITISILPTDAGFTSDGCGSWVRSN